MSHAFNNLCFYRSVYRFFQSGKVKKTEKTEDFLVKVQSELEKMTTAERAHFDAVPEAYRRVVIRWKNENEERKAEALKPYFDLSNWSMEDIVDTPLFQRDWDDTSIGNWTHIASLCEMTGFQIIIKEGCSTMMNYPKNLIPNKENTITIDRYDGGIGHFEFRC